MKAYSDSKNQFSRILLADKNGRDAGAFFETGTKINNRLFIVTDPHVQSTAGPARLIVYDPGKKQVAICQSTLVFSVLSFTGNRRYSCIYH